VLKLHLAIACSRKAPKVVGTTNLFLVDETIVNETLIDISNTTKRKRECLRIL
jgi:hypothetical protein